MAFFRKNREGGKSSGTGKVLDNSINILFVCFWRPLPSPQCILMALFRAAYLWGSGGGQRNVIENAPFVSGVASATTFYSR